MPNDARSNLGKRESLKHISLSTILDESQTRRMNFPSR